ncbi:OprO/OprP family phosphate-selective porin [Halosquirtibacter xylanolyticus]|uniref:porin n=1 Tax=Halosquirtibacter xylanolyticus TaxID=3374599 RepID=UPI0037497304|nr:OprO/OprP family phosphate-selective porin [Prolixibacteraceae bacterium]
MKKFAITLMLQLLVVSILFAQEMKHDASTSFFKQHLTMPVDGRIEYNYLDYEKNFANYGSTHKFQFSDLLFRIEGMLTPNIGFNFRTVFNSNDINANNILDNIQAANITYTTDNNKWFFSAGRFFMNVGTVEQYYNPADVYIYSVVGNNLGVYKTGVTAQYTTTNLQSFGFQLMNADNASEKQDMEYNLYWYGHIVKDKIETYMSVTAKDKGGADDTPYAINLGIGWNFKDLHIDTDYARVENMPNFYANAVYTSVPIKIAYNWDYFKPYIKYMYNKVDFDGDGYDVPMEDGSTETIDNTAIHTIELALQYYPLKDKNLRLYVTGAYSSDGNISIVTPDAPASSTRQHYNAEFQIMAGVRIGFDLLRGWK